MDDSPGEGYPADKPHSPSSGMVPLSDSADERPCIVCGRPVVCDPGYPPDVDVVHPECAIEPLNDSDGSDSR